MKFNLRWSVLLLALPLAGGLVAQEALPGAVETGNTMATEVPPGLEEKPPLSDYDLSKKKEGSYFTGLPLINSDADKGVGYGVRLYWYDNGEKSNPFLDIRLISIGYIYNVLLAMVFSITPDWKPLYWNSLGAKN